MLGFSARRHWAGKPGVVSWPAGLCCQAAGAAQLGRMADQLPTAAPCLAQRRVPVGQVNSRRFSRLPCPRVLAAAGVKPARTPGAEPAATGPGGGLILRLAGPDPRHPPALESSQVFWPQERFCRKVCGHLLCPNLRHSWARCAGLSGILSRWQIPGLSRGARQGRATACLGAGRPWRPRSPADGRTLDCFWMLAWPPGGAVALLGQINTGAPPARRFLWPTPIPRGWSNACAEGWRCWIQPFARL